MIAGGLSGSTSTGAAGTMANAAAPALQYAVGQYFKDQKAEGSTAHIVAHTVLAAAVAAAGGNDALTAGISAGASEALAPVVAKWLYGEGKDDFKPSEMTPDQKATVSNIVSLGAAGFTATAGGTGADVVQGSQLASSAVEDNFSVYYLLPDSLKEYILDKIGGRISVGAAGKIAAGEGLESQLTVSANGDITISSGATHGVAIELGPVTSWQLLGASPDGAYTRFTAKGGVGVTITKSATGWSLSVDASPGAEVSLGTGIIEQIPRKK